MKIIYDYDEAVSLLDKLYRAENSITQGVELEVRILSSEGDPYFKIKEKDVVELTDEMIQDLIKNNELSVGYQSNE